MASRLSKNLVAANTGDPRDRIIAALLAHLKAERETRETLELVIRNGVSSNEILEAIVADPVPAFVDCDVSSHDLAEIERVIALGRMAIIKDRN